MSNILYVSNINKKLRMHKKMLTKEKVIFFILGGGCTYMVDPGCKKYGPENNTSESQ